MSLTMAQTWTTQSGVECTNHEAKHLTTIETQSPQNIKDLRNCPSLAFQCLSFENHDLFVPGSLIRIKDLRGLLSKFSLCHYSESTPPATSNNFRRNNYKFVYTRCSKPLTEQLSSGADCMSTSPVK